MTYIDANDGGGGVNVPRVTTATATCVTPGVRPVPDGSSGTGMTASRTDGTGASINLTWNVATCSSTDHHLIYGDLATRRLIDGKRRRVQPRNFGDQHLGRSASGQRLVRDRRGRRRDHRGSWGTYSGGAQRGGVAVSGQCGMTTRDNSGTCP